MVNFTQQIRLEEISRSEYTALRREWGIIKESEVLDTYAKIVNPFIAEEYEEIIDAYLKHPAAKCINVFDKNSGWQSYEVKDLSRVITDNIIDLAENDLYGRDNFELRFQPLQPNAEGIKERAKIIFREEGDLLVGYAIKVHRGNLALFDSRIINPRHILVSAIADPREIR